MSQVWFECAPAPYDESKRPQTDEQVDAFIYQLNYDESVKSDVWRRFVVTRGKRKFVSWMNSSWFFKNFNSEQLKSVRAKFLN